MLYTLYMMKNKEIEKVEFKRTGCAGRWIALINGIKIATIYQRDDRSFWWISPDFRLAIDIDSYAPTLRNIKNFIRDAVAEHTGRTIWHAGE